MLKEFRRDLVWSDKNRNLFLGKIYRENFSPLEYCKIKLGNKMNDAINVLGVNSGLWSELNSRKLRLMACIISIPSVIFRPFIGILACYQFSTVEEEVVCVVIFYQPVRVQYYLHLRADFPAAKHLSTGQKKPGCACCIGCVCGWFCSPFSLHRVIRICSSKKLWNSDVWI